MIERRAFLLFSAAAVSTAVLRPVAPAVAQGADRASAFIKSTGDKLVAVINSSAPAQQKRKELTSIIESTVDIDGVARFCLGRFWRQATPDQQKNYIVLFRQVLVTSISVKLGEYQGVRFTIGRSRPQDGEQVVSTVIERPNNAPATVEWVVGHPQSSPKIIDVIAEGTSLRITQRSDYASFLQRNGNNIDALLTAMRNQLAQSG
ncbi:MAG: phospholipid-binding protein MlaC [Acetobacteraceae bacterium]